MDRRSFLSWTLGGTLGGLTGCSSGAIQAPEKGSPDAGTGGRGTTRAPTPGPADRGREGPSGTDLDLPLPRDELVRAAPKDLIAAITEPAFAADWSGLSIDIIEFEGKTIEPRLEPDERVVGVVRDGEARAYPLRILNWHEVVNDTFGGPLLVTYCPLCGSAVTAERTVNGEEATFGVSGLLWNSALVMYDEPTGSLWSQIAARAVRGPATGERLDLVPSTTTTWGTWREDHPDTEVLLPPPESNTVRGRDNPRNYTKNPYSGYGDSQHIGTGRNELPESDADLHPKAQVIGVTSGSAAKAYPLDEVVESGAVNDTVGGLPVVVAAARDGVTLAAHVRRVRGETLTFERGSATHLLAGGSRWTVTTGRAVDGPYEGTALEPATEMPQMFWFAWLDFHPHTAVYGPDG